MVCSFLWRQNVKINALLGADVGHPAPGNQHRPSVAGVVASVGPFPNQMIAMNNVQEPRTEVIQDLDEMISVGHCNLPRCSPYLNHTSVACFGTVEKMPLRGESS